MKIFKRIVSLMLCIVLLTTTFSACSTFNLNNIDSAITKGEWIETLGRYFGFSDTYETGEISINKYIDLCKKWSIIPENEDVKIDEKITREYALALSTYAIGKEITNFDCNNKSIKGAANYAVSKEIGESNSWKYLHEGVTSDEADKILTKAIAVYNDREFAEYDNTDYNKNVKFEKNTDLYRVDSVNNQVIVNQNENQYDVGDIVVFGEGVNKKALKIVNSYLNDGNIVFDTETPDITEICDVIDVSGYANPGDVSKVKTADGVTLTNYNGNILTDSFKTPDVEYLGTDIDKSLLNTAKHDVKDNKSLSDLTFKVELSSGKIEASGSYKDFEVAKEKERKKKDTKGNEIDNDQIQKWSSDGDVYKGGYKITGSFTIDLLKIAANIKYNTADFLWQDTGLINLFDPIDSYDINIDSKVTNNLSLQGYLNETIDLTPSDGIPFELGPLSLKVKIQLYGKINGEIGIKIVYYNNTSIKWSSENGFKKVVEKDMERDFEMNVTLEEGFKFTLDIGLFQIDIIDLSATIGVELKIKFEMNDLILADEGLYLHGGDEKWLTNAEDVCLLCFDATLSPIVKLGINTDDSLLAELNKKLDKVTLGYEWEIVGGDDATFTAKIPLHYELDLNKFVDSCTKDSLKQYKKSNEAEMKEEKQVAESEESSDLNKGLSLDSYALDIQAGESKTLKILSLPENCKKDDIKITINDESIAYLGSLDEIRNGYGMKIKGVSAGITTVVIECGDSSLNCTIIVTE